MVQSQASDGVWVSRIWRRVHREMRGARHRMVLEPLCHVSRSADGYRVTGTNPEFGLRSERGVLPSGWVTLSYRWSGGLGPNRLTLLADAVEAQTVSYLLPACHPETPVMIRLPPGTCGMRLEPPAGVGSFELDAFEVVDLSAAQTVRELLRPYVDVVRREPGMAWHFFRRGLEVLRRHGVRELEAAVLVRSTQRTERGYADWVRRYDTLTARDESAARRQLARHRLQPTFTMIAPLGPDQTADGAHAIRTLRNQWYTHWELLVVETQRLPHALQAAFRQLCGTDTRIRFLDFDETAQPPDTFNRVLAHATGTFCGMIDFDAHIAPHALFTMAAEHNEHPDVDMMYSDEDHIDAGGQRHTPRFKPDWNADLLCSHPYVGHLTVYRTAVLRSIGGWRGGIDDLHDWDVALRASAVIPETHIRHIPHVLYHADTGTHGAPGRLPTQSATARRILNEHLQRLGVVAALSEDAHGLVRIRYPLGEPPPLVSLIIPTRNGRPLLERCVTTLRQKTDYTNVELLIIDNQSDDSATLAYLKELQARPHTRVLRFDEPFNFSAVNNFAAAHARGAILAFLNNDVEVLTEAWLTEMVGHALRPEVGAVGAKLYYPDGRIQHAGIVLGLGKLAGHIYRGLPEPAAGPSARTFFVQSVSAVTGACLVIRAEIYHAVGGFDVNLPVAYGDVDLCLRLRQRGYRIVWTPHAQLYHWESATRGLDYSVRKIKRLRREQALMLKRWGAALDQDPAYNPNLTLAAPSSALAFPPRVRKPWSARR